VETATSIKTVATAKTITATTKYHLCEGDG